MDVNEELKFMGKLKKKTIFFFLGGGGGPGAEGRVVGGGGQDGCERRIEVSVKIQNQRTNGPVNAHLISWPCKAQNIQNLEIIW